MLDSTDSDEVAPALLQFMQHDLSHESRVFFNSFDKSTGNLMEFGIFPYLPLELRDLIWESTIEPRVISISTQSWTMAQPEQNACTKVKTPIIFSVCQESRSLALSKHTSLIEDAERRKIYFIPRLDTIYFQDMFFFDLITSLDEEAISKIRFLAMQLIYSSSLTSLFQRRGFSLCSYKSLRSLILARALKFNASLESHENSGRCLNNDVTGFRQISTEEQFMLGEFQSDFIEDAAKKYLQDNLPNCGWNPTIPIPLVENLIEVEDGKIELVVTPGRELVLRVEVDSKGSSLREDDAGENHKGKEICPEHVKPLPLPTFNYYAVLASKTIPTFNYYSILYDVEDDVEDDVEEELDEESDQSNSRDRCFDEVLHSI